MRQTYSYQTDYYILSPSPKENSNLLLFQIRLFNK